MNRLLAPLQGRIQMMIGRAVIRAANDSLKAQGLQVELLDGEVQDGVEHFQNYGFTSVPLAGAEAVVAFVGGLRGHGICIATVDRKVRLTAMQPGEVALHDDQGQKIHLTRDGIVIETDKPIAITSAEVVTIDAPSIALAGGGAAIARVGDDVDLGSGKIISGSEKVTAG
ncbi:MAG TPA: phage baseplate assembly protein V [Sphingobium sp.]